jgi:hypothetical protein
MSLLANAGDWSLGFRLSFTLFALEAERQSKGQADAENQP